MPSPEAPILQLFRALLDDEHGVSHEAYVRLGALALRNKDREALLDLLYRCDCTDGRYYLPEEA